MAIVRINLKPNDQQLQQFGTAALIALPLIGWVWTRDVWLTGWLFAAGATLAIVSRICPMLIRPVFVGTTLLTLPVGMIVGELTMLLVFFGMLTPLAIFFRLRGRDIMDRGFDRSARSYWRPCRKSVSAESYYRQS